MCIGAEGDKKWVGSKSKCWWVSPPLALALINRHLPLSFITLSQWKGSSLWWRIPVCRYHFLMNSFKGYCNNDIIALPLATYSMTHLVSWKEKKKKDHVGERLDNITKGKKIMLKMWGCEVMIVEGNTRKLTTKPTTSLKLQGNIVSLLKQRVSFQRFVPKLLFLLSWLSTCS